MEFDWSEEVTGFPADKLDRAKYAAFLTNFLSSMKDESYVMNLNAEWGAGKTYFIKRWYEEIKEHYPAAYIDAWKNDFSEEPLLTVISAITETLELNPNVAAEKYRKETFKKGARLMKQLAPALLKGVLKTYTGVDTDDVTQEREFDLDNFNDAAVKALEIGLSEHKEKVESLNKFKEIISNWLEEVVGLTHEGKLEKPMFVFIDELDRCRPTYAIELLETVKHLFEIRGIIFVIATDTKQLQHSIKAVYGEGFDARKYLDRFFNRTFSLKQVDLSSFIESLPIYQNKIKDYFVKTLNERVDFEGSDNVLKALTTIAMTFEFDLRSTEQWIHQLYSCYAKENSLHQSFWLLTAILIALKKASLSNYDLIALRNNLNTHDYNNLNSSFKFTKEIKFKYKYEGLKKITWTIQDSHFGNIEQNENVSEKEITGNGKYTIISLISIAVDVFSQEKLNELVFEMSKENLDESIFRSLLSNERVNEKAELENYIDLVEMASDLT